MPDAALRVVRGYVMDITHLAFTSGAVPGDNELLGCVSYGQWRYYTVQTTSAEDAQVAVTLDRPVGGLYAAAGRQPSADIGRLNRADFHQKTVSR